MTITQAWGPGNFAFGSNTCFLHTLTHLTAVSGRRVTIRVRCAGPVVTGGNSGHVIDG